MALDIEYYEKELAFWREEALKLRKQLDEAHERELVGLRGTGTTTKETTVKQPVKPPPGEVIAKEVVTVFVCIIVGVVVLFGVGYALVGLAMWVTINFPLPL
jgi:hypothetical protein